MFLPLYTRTYFFKKPQTESMFRNCGGFSIIEVLVTAFVIGLITAIVLFKYGSFNNVILLKSQAYEMALDLREAQVYAVSVRGGDNEFRQEYGVHFDIDDPGQYQLFLDSPSSDNGRYDNGEEVELPNYIDDRFQISAICVNFSSSCNNGTAVDTLAVTFRRPDFDAIFVSTGPSVGSISNARIELSSNNGSISRAVEVNLSGQIDIQ